MTNPPLELHNDNLLTVAEVAAMMRVARMTVYRLVNKTEELRAFRAGHSIRIYESSVRAYLRRQEIGR